MMFGTRTLKHMIFDHLGALARLSADDINASQNRDWSALLLRDQELKLLHSRWHGS